LPARGAAEVVAGARNKSALESLSAEAGALASRIVPVKLDVTSNEDVAVAASLGRADILINNAGYAVIGSALKLPIDELEREFHTNYFGVLRMVRAFGPAMVEHKDGLIVNVASQLSKVSLPILGNYCATKAALMSLSHSLRGDLAHLGVRVVTVFPGMMDTDMVKNFPGDKNPPAASAAEVLKAIEEEPVEVPVGNDARGLFAGLAHDAKAVQEGMLQYRA
jgi:hypothetical protein